LIAKLFQKNFTVQIYLNPFAVGREFSETNRWYEDCERFEIADLACKSPSPQSINANRDDLLVKMEIYKKRNKFSHASFYPLTDP
jgi:hypothetical protein